MKKVFCAIMFLFALTVCTLSLQAQNGTVSCSNMTSEDELAYKDGEELVYAANYTWGPIWTDVGELELKTRRIVGTPIRYYVRGDARTYKFYDNFFKVRDLYECSFEIPSMRPVHFYRDINEGDYSMKNTYRFDWYKNLIRVNIQKQKLAARDTILHVASCSFDVLTFFYHSRNLDFRNVKHDQIFSTILVIDDEVYTIKFRFVKREAKKIKSIGTVNCLRFSVGVVAGSVFKGDEQIDMWVSDDNNHVPLLLETPIVVGKIKGRLKSYKNLKYPLNMAK